METTTTRRNLIRLATSAAAYAGGAAIVGGGIALASEAHGATLDRAAWDHATATMTRLKGAYEAANERLTAASLRADRVRPEEAMVPHQRIGIRGERHVLLFADADHLEQQWRDTPGPDWLGDAADPASRAHGFAQLRKYQRLEREAEERYNVGELNAQLDAASEAYVDAVVTLMDLPAPDLPALHWKLQEVFPDEGDSTVSWSRAYVEQMLRDIDRLLGGETQA